MNLSLSLNIALATRAKGQKWLAEESGVGSVTISKVSQGHTGVSIGIVDRLADALAYSMSEFIALGEV